MEISVPPLRERKVDIELLLEYFLEKICTSEGGRSKTFSQEAKTILLNYAYPGNVRELKNVVEGSYFSTPGDNIDVGHIPTQVRKIRGRIQFLGSRACGVASIQGNP